MCLILVHEKEDRLLVKEGYKIFKVSSTGKLSANFRSFNFKKRRWIKDNNINSITWHNYADGELGFYQAGFHVFTNETFAKLYSIAEEVVHRVLVKEIVASGLQSYQDKTSATVVCRQIYIMEEVE